MGIVDHFTTIIAPKLITLFFNLPLQNVVDIQNWLLCQKVYPSSTSCLLGISGNILTDDVTSGTNSTTINYAYMRSW